MRSVLYLVPLLVSVMSPVFAQVDPDAIELHPYAEPTRGGAVVEAQELVLRGQRLAGYATLFEKTPELAYRLSQAGFGDYLEGRISLKEVSQGFERGYLKQMHIKGITTGGVFALTEQYSAFVSKLPDRLPPSQNPVLDAALFANGPKVAGKVPVVVLDPVGDTKLTDLLREARFKYRPADVGIQQKLAGARELARAYGNEATPVLKLFYEEIGFSTKVKVENGRVLLEIRDPKSRGTWVHANEEPHLSIVRQNRRLLVTYAGREGVFGQAITNVAPFGEKPSLSVSVTGLGTKPAALKGTVVREIPVIEAGDGAHNEMLRPRVRTSRESVRRPLPQDPPISARGLTGPLAFMGAHFVKEGITGAITGDGQRLANMAQPLGDPQFFRGLVVFGLAGKTVDVVTGAMLKAYDVLPGPRTAVLATRTGASLFLGTLAWDGINRELDMRRAAASAVGYGVGGFVVDAFRAASQYQPQCRVARILYSPMMLGLAMSMGEGIEKGISSALKSPAPKRWVSSRRSGGSTSQTQ